MRPRSACFGFGYGGYCCEARKPWGVVFGRRLEEHGAAVRPTRRRGLWMARDRIRFIYQQRVIRTRVSIVGWVEDWYASVDPIQTASNFFCNSFFLLYFVCQTSSSLRRSFLKHSLIRK